ncbi:hypothetical protein CI102_3790 [Trichoderma harzianum]|nr:hypothetical protein CI102_3790 [Trichoderma harzianum]
MFFSLAAASHHLVQPLSRPEPLAAKGTNLLHIVIRHTNTLRTIPGPFVYTICEFYRRYPFQTLGLSLLLFLFFQVFTIALAPSPLSNFLL